MSDLIREPLRLFTLKGNYPPITHISISPDEQMFVCIGRGENKNESTLCLFNPKTGKTLGKFDPVENHFTSLRWSKDGTRAYLTSKDGNIWFLTRNDIDIEITSNLFRSAKNGESHLTVLQNDLVAFVTDTGLVRVLEWTGTTHKIVYESRRNNTPFSGIVANPNSPTFIAISWRDYQLFGYSSNDIHPKWGSGKLETHAERIFQCGWTPNGTLLFLEKNKITLIAPTRNSRIICYSHRVEYSHLVVVDDETILLSTKNPNYVLVVQIPDGNILCDISGFNNPVEHMCLYGNGRYLATSTSNKIPFESLGQGGHPVQIFDFGSENIGRGNTPFIRELPV
ncbi:MAG: hypothetical protein NTX72_01365 [Candidatus Uhrbacteria bacterium]|nr:hypothetical protein [Candidatus Uhrbacteria bacterium]